MSWIPTLTKEERTAARSGSFHPKITRAQIGLDKLDRNAVILDGTGQAWQYGGWRNPYWYRAFGDDSFVSTFDLVQIINGKYTVIWPQEET